MPNARVKSHRSEKLGPDYAPVRGGVKA
jgi:hypothetical protein